MVFVIIVLTFIFIFTPLGLCWENCECFGSSCGKIVADIKLVHSRNYDECFKAMSKEWDQYAATFNIPPSEKRQDIQLLSVTGGSGIANLNEGCTYKESYTHYSRCYCKKKRWYGTSTGRRVYIYEYPPADDPCPKYKSGYKRDCKKTKKSRTLDSPFIGVCVRYTREVRENHITGFRVLSYEDHHNIGNEHCGIDGKWILMNHDLNQKAGGNWIYFCKRRSHTDPGAALVGFDIRYSYAGGCINSDLNANAGGEWIYACPEWGGCSKCRNQYTLATQCSECEANYEKSTDCKYCRNKYDLASSCTQCEYGYSLATECTACEHYKLSPASNCKGCQYPNYVYNPALPATDTCKVCKWGYDLDTNCEICVHDQLDLGQSCRKCVNPYFADSRHWYWGVPTNQNPADSCKVCKNGNMDPDDQCRSCLNANMEVETECTSCKTNYKYETGVPWQENCDTCVSTALSLDDDCLKCTDMDRMNSDGAPEEMCKTCQKRYGPDPHPDDDPPVGCQDCKVDWFGWECRMRCHESCNHGSCKVYGMENFRQETADYTKCACESGYVGHDCALESCQHDDFTYCRRKMDLEESCTTIFRKAGPHGGIFSKDNIIQNYVDGLGDCASGDCFRALALGNAFSTSNTIRSMRTVAIKDSSTYLSECDDVYIFGVEDGYRVDYEKCVGSTELEGFIPQYMWFSARDDPDVMVRRTCTAVDFGWWIDDQCLSPMYDDFDRVETRICSFEPHVIEQSAEPFIIRQFGNLHFSNRTFEEYQRGFGNCRTGDCFRGLDYIHAVTKTSSFAPVILKMTMSHDGKTYSPQCEIKVGSKAENYKLQLKNCVVDPPTSQINIQHILFHNLKEFSDGFWSALNGDKRMNPTGRIGVDGEEGMFFTSLSGTESLAKFNWHLSGGTSNVVDKLTLPKFKQDLLNGQTCKKFLVRKHGRMNFGWEETMEQKFWNDYRKGFGDCATEDCWLGLRDLHSMTFGNPQKMVFDIETEKELFSLICYDFWVDTEENEYRLHFSKCEGSYELDDYFVHQQNGRPFSTVDHNIQSINCASRLKSGWWFNDAGGNKDECHAMNLNPTGLFRNSGELGVYFPGLDQYGSVRSFEMSICGMFEEEFVDMEEHKKCIPFLERRADGVLNFERSFSQYEHGFGDCDLETRSECFLGLKHLNRLTEIPQYLSVDLVFDGQEYLDVFHCGLFQVDGIGNDYAIHFVHCAEDEDSVEAQWIYNDIISINHNKFSTYDHHASYVGADVGNPARDMKGGWWYPNSMTRPLFHATGMDSIHLDSFGDLTSIRMSVCQLNALTEEPQVHSKRSCNKDCDSYLNQPFPLDVGEQLYQFSEDYYAGDYLEVVTGPKYALDNSLVSGTKSFFSKKINRPMIFSNDHFGYSIYDSYYMTIRDHCFDLETCGWESYSDIRSAFVPANYILTFQNQKPQNMDPDFDTYELGGSGKAHFDPAINFEVQGWSYTEVGDDFVEVKYPVFYEGAYNSGNKFEAKYDCKRNCDAVYGFQSLFVPEGYVVEAFELPEYEGVSRKFVGPMFLPRFDGYFQNHNIMSFKSDMTKLERIVVEILEYYFDRARIVDKEDKNVNQITVVNPTSVTKEVMFTDEYTQYVERNWQLTQLGITEENRHMTETVSTQKATEKTRATQDVHGVSLLQGLKVEAGGSGGLFGFYVAAQLEAEALIGQGIQFIVEKEEVDTEEQEKEVFKDVFHRSESVVGTETAGLNSWSVTKTFEYSCTALPFSKTTCQALQKTGIYSIPYSSQQVWYYTDGTIEIKPNPEAWVESVCATSIDFNIIEDNYDGYCKSDFTGMKGDCFKSKSISANIEDVFEALISPSEVQYERLSLEEGMRLCYRDDGASLTSIHDSMENYFFQKLCSFEPVLTGVVYDPAIGGYQNLDGTEVDFVKTRLFTTSVPDELSYVVIDNSGYWTHFPMNSISNATCVICKKDVNVKMMGDDLYQLSGLSDPNDS